MKTIRYTQGPAQVELGGVVFKRGEAQDIGEELAAQALLPQRVAEYGFEEYQEPVGARFIAPKKPSATTAPAPIEPNKE